MGKQSEQTNEQKKKAAAEKIWLNYFNQYLYEHDKHIPIELP